MMNDQELTCPNCGSEIRIDTRRLLNDARFTCPVCLSEFAMDMSDSRETLDIMQSLDAIKKSLSNKPGPG